MCWWKFIGYMCVRGPKQNLLKLLNTPVMSNTVLPRCYVRLKVVDRRSYPLCKLSALLPVHILSTYEECKTRQDKTRQDNVLFGVLYNPKYIDFISCVITSGHDKIRFVQSIWSAWLIRIVNSSLYEANQARSKCNIPCSITHKAQKSRSNRISRSIRARIVTWFIRTFITGQVYWTALGMPGRKE